ncbi:MAG TPA: PQQ-dependent sugar dehydrogenase [Steroidobacteraceae bacterium]|nr:PQQ-dependent sugar dehydrogenase [Steroidobacteraceae bacterium]
MRSIAGRNWRCILGCLLLAAAGPASRAATVPAGFTDKAINRPDGKPWAAAAGMVLAEGGRQFVWERGGKVWVMGSGASRTRPLLDLSDEVTTNGTLGLTGFALDPQFNENGYLYLFYAVEPQHLASCDTPVTGPPSCRGNYRPGEHAPVGATIGRLVRYQLVRPAAGGFRDSREVNYASRRVLLGESTIESGASPSCVATDTGHGSGAIVFGADGTLLVACGDGASTSAQDAGSEPGTQYRQALAAGLMRAAENVGAFRAQLLDSLSGKILRLEASTGDGLPGNPHFAPAAPRAARSRVWVMGLRDPQHFAVRPGSGSSRAADGRPGTLYIGDVGFSTWESLAVARTGNTNFGWPLYEGIGNDTTSYAGLAPASADLPEQSWARSRPSIDWLHGAADARWAGFDSSGEPVAVLLGTRAPNGVLVTGPLFGGTQSIGGVWYQGADFPPLFRNVYFQADSGGGWIRAFAFDSQDRPIAVRDFLTEGGPIAALGAHPDSGGLYYITGLFGSELHHLTYSASGAASGSPASDSAGAIGSVASRGSVSADGSVSAKAGASAASRATRSVAIGSAARLAQSAAASPTWSSQDIGAVGAAGSFALSGSTFTVMGSGADIWNKADAFQLVSQSLSGDGSITAHVVSQSNTNVWAKAGVMLRETANAGSAYIAMEVTPAEGTSLQARTATSISAVSKLGPFVKAPYWVRLVRAGNQFTGFASANGVTWTTVGQYTIPMASQILVGLAVCSHANGSLSTVVFDNVTLSSAAPPPPDTQPPTVPTGLAATNLTTNSVTLGWNAATDLPSPGGTGVGGYLIYRNGNTAAPFATVTTGTSFTDSGLSAGTNYTYQVAAFDLASPANVSAPSSALTVTTAAPDTQPPTTPSGLTITNATLASLTLIWNAASDLPSPGGTGIGGYFIYRNGNTTTPIATVSSGTTFTDSALTPATTYSYQVAAFDRATPPNVSPPSTSVSGTTLQPDTQPPTVPGGVTVLGTTAASVTLSWTPSTDLPNPGGAGVGGYFIYRNGDTTNPVGTVTAGTVFTDSALTPGTSYSYQVASFDLAAPPNVSTPSGPVSAITQNVLGAAQIGNLIVNNGGQTTYAVCGGGGSCASSFVAGAPQYVDSSVITLAAPIPPIANGQTYIQTAQADASAAAGSATFVSFTVAQSAVVYVAHDVQIAPPGWLTSNFLDTGLSFTNNDGSPGATFEIYSNVYSAGAQVQLGGNTPAGVIGRNMYSVVVAPTATSTIAPDAPSALAPIPGCQSATVAGFTWNAALVNPGGLPIAGYRITRDGTTVATVSYAQTMYQDTSVTQMTTYAYAVTAFDQAGNLSAPVTLSVATNAQSPTGDAPYCPSTFLTGMSFNYLSAYSDTNGNGNSTPTAQVDSPPFTDGSDLWPLTQAADNNTYAFFGDGWGICGTADTGSGEAQDRTSFGFARLAAAPVGPGCPAGAANVYGGYNSSRPFGGFSTCCTSNAGLILGKATAVLAVGNDFYALGNAWRSLDSTNWINVKLNNHPPSGAPGNHQEVISSTGAGNGAQQWTDSGVDLCNGSGTAANPIWGGALAVCPTGFVQFGPGHTGLPASLSGYAYVYAMPTPSFLAGIGAAVTYLLRVPLTPTVQMLNPAAWQYFAGLDANGNPIWSSNGSRKQAVFNDQIDQSYQYFSADGTACAGQKISMGMVLGEAVYDQALGRFIATAQGAHVGQVSFYEAPSPWGPWSVISYSNLSMSNLFSSGWGAAGGGLGGGFCSGGTYIDAESLGIHIASGFTDSTGTVLQIVFSSSGVAPASAGALGGFNANPNGFGNSMDSFNMVPATLVINQGSH